MSIEVTSRLQIRELLHSYMHCLKGHSLKKEHTSIMFQTCRYIASKKLHIVDRKNLGEHHTCLGDIAQNILGFFAHFPRGAWGECWFLKSSKFQYYD